MRLPKLNLLLTLLTISISFIFINDVWSQVSNDDQFQYELYIGLVQPLVNGDSGFGPQDEWVVKFIDQTDIDNSASTLGSIDKCGPIFRVDPGEAVVGPDDDDDGVIDGRANISLSPFAQLENNAGKKAIDINMRIFEDDSRSTGDNCSTTPIEHDETAIVLLTIDETTVDNFTGGQNFAGAIGVSTTGVNTTVAYAWRYTRGEVNNPLSFGSIDYNTPKTHLNSNRIKPILSASSTALGIHNSFLNYPDLEGPPSRDAGEVYYSFSIDSESKVTISTDNATTTANTFLVLKRSDGSLRASGNQEMADLILDAGTYTITVDGTNGGGLFELSVLRELANPPTNAACSSPKLLTCSTVLSGEDNTAVGGDNAGDCQNGTQHNALWYRFDGDGSTIRIDIEQAGFTPNIDLFINNNISNCNNLDCQASGGNSLVYKTTSGITYWIVVYSDSSNDFGTFDLRFRCRSGSINDNCNDASQISYGNMIHDSTTFSRPFDTPNCLETNDDIRSFRGSYYSFQGDGTLTRVNVLEDDETFLLYYLYSGTCGNLICEVNNTVFSDIEFQTQQGVDYTILVLSGNGEEVSYSLSLTGANNSPNDNCSVALDLTIGDGQCQVPVNSNNIDATDSGIDHGCARYEGGDVWFTFVAPATGNVTVETSNDGSGNFDSGMAVYDGCGTSATEIGCIDDGAGLTGSFSKLVMTGLTGGETYYVAVWRFNNSSTGTFNICAYDHTSSDPCVDGYTGARALSGIQNVPRDFETDQSIESSQIIGSAANRIAVRYFPGTSGQSATMNEGFEIKSNTLFEVWFEGCF